MKICTDSVLLGAWAAVDDASRVVDLGAGSGLLSLMVAQRNPYCSITAVEIDPEACLDAADNFRAFSAGGALTVVNADALAFEPVEAPDLIICNPPYFTSELKSPDAARACARHGAGLLPETAVGLAAKWLSPAGRLAMVTPADGASDLVFSAEMSRLHLRRQCFVSQVEGKTPTRILWEFSKVDGPVGKEAISIRDRRGDYTPDYINLTKDFYLKF